MHLTPGSTRRHARTAAAALTTLALLACGGSDGPTTPIGPDPDPTPPPPAALRVGADTVRANEFVTLRPAGYTGVLPDTVTGEVGTAQFLAFRSDDSTLVGLVPAGVTGAQTVRFEIEGRPYTSQLVLEPAVTASDPVAAATSLFDQVVARYDSAEAMIRAGRTNGVDTAAVRSFASAGRAAIEQARADFLALSAEEQAAALPFILAGAASVGLDVGGSASARTARPSGLTLGFMGAPSAGAQQGILCDALSPFDACNQLARANAAVREGASKLASCARTTYTTAAVTGILGGALGGAISAYFTAGLGTSAGVIAGIKNGVAIGAGIGLGWCMSDLWVRLDDVYDSSVNAVLVSVEADLAASPRVAAPAGGPLAAGISASRAAAREEGGTYTVGVPAKVDVYVDFKTISAADAGGPAPLAALVTAFNGVAASWDKLRAKYPSLDLPAISLPTGSRVVARKKVPAAYLSVGAIAPSPISASTAGGEDWMVTFQNSGQGDDHEFTYDVQFAFAGFPVQKRTLGGTLRPSRYTVAALTLGQSTDTVMVDQSMSFEWTAADSSGDVLTDSLLAGRKPTWSTASTNVVQVSASSGSVKGLEPGTASVKATLETGEATGTVAVIRDVTGTYVLVELDGTPIPGTTWEDSTYKIVTHGGSVTLSADGTFSFGHSATGSNKLDSQTFDEGGSGAGTYEVQAGGAAVMFETTSQTGDLVIATAFIDGDYMIASISGPGVNASAKLKKQ